MVRSCDSNGTADTSTSATNNVTVIEVSSSTSNHVFTFSDVGSELSGIERTQAEVSTVSVMPINSNFENVSIIRRPVHIECEERNASSNGNHCTILKFNSYPRSTVFVRNECAFAGRRVENERQATSSERASENGVDATPVVNSNLYEHVFPSTAPHTTSVGGSQQSSSPCVNTPLSPVAIESKLLSPITSVNMQSSTPSQVSIREHKCTSTCI